MRRNDVEARQLLLQRKKRGRQSCYPCRTRKVKCDKCSPCDQCNKSGYPELCTYDGRQVQDTSIPVASTASAGTPHASSASTPDTYDLRRPVATKVHSLPESGVNLSSSPRTRSGNEDSPANNGERPYFGANSIPNLLRSHASQEDARNMVENAFMPMMGFGSQASVYPFMAPAETTQEDIVHRLYQALPAGRHVVRLFQCYLEKVHTLSPILPDIESFEVELCQFVEARASAKQQKSSDDQRFRIQTFIAWLALLFAVLSCGEQFSDDEVMQRREKSKLYSQHAFQCLRIVDFLTRPTVLCIQTLLVLGQVLQNDSRPEVAWTLLGTTVRMAQSLGLHEMQDSASFGWQLWSALVRQDILLSSCYDRPPVTMSSSDLLTPPGPLSYTTAMDLLSGVMLGSGSIGNGHNLAGMGFVKINTLVKAIEDIEKRHSTESINRSTATSIKCRCKQHLFSLHASFAVAWLCRPAIRRRMRSNPDPVIAQSLRETCLDRLLECVKSFVKLSTLTMYAVKSWPIIHNGLSSALLLGLLGDSRRYADVRHWQKEILDIFSGDQGSNEGATFISHGSIELSAPHARAIAELKKIHERDEPGSMEVPVSSDCSAVDATYDTSITDTSEPSSHAYDALQQRAFQQSELSPLDLFDEILWDPVDTSQFASHYDPNWFESVMF